jgi:O-antigen ligase
MPNKPHSLFKHAGLLCVLFVVSTLISQSLMDLFASIFSFYMLFQVVRLRGKIMAPKVFQTIGFEWVFVAWMVVVAIGFAINPAAPGLPTPYYWLVRLLEFRWLLLIYLVVTTLREWSFEIKHLRWFVGAGLVTSIYSIIDFILKYKVDTESINRLEGPFQFSMTHAHVYGPYFCALLGILLWNFRKLSNPQKWCFGLATILMGLTVVLTMTRGVWIGVFVAVIVMGFLWQPKRGLIILIASVMAVIGLYLAVPAIKNRIDYSLRIMQPGVTRNDTYDTERVVLWKTNLMMFKEHPIFGVGYGQNKFLLRSYYDQQGLPPNQFVGHAHNQYVHLLAGTGVLGLLCYLSFVLGLLVLTYKTYSHLEDTNLWAKGIGLGIIGAQISYLVGGLTESNFEHSKVRYAMLVIWSLAVWLHQTYAKQTTLRGEQK